MKGQNLNLNLSSMHFWDMVGLRKDMSVMILRHIALGFLVMLFFTSKIVVSFPMFYVWPDFLRVPHLGSGPNTSNLFRERIG